MGVLRALGVASVVTGLIYAAMAIITLDRAAMIDVLPAAVSRVGMWVLVGFFALGAIPNAVSRSRHERYTMTPTTLLLAVLALITALASDESTG